MARSRQLGCAVCKMFEDDDEDDFCEALASLGYYTGFSVELPPEEEGELPTMWVYSGAEPVEAIPHEMHRHIGKDAPPKVPM